MFAPCALGGGAGRRQRGGRCSAKIICGGANNQLAHAGVEKVLADRGILYAPDYVVNAGGVIQVADELHGFSFDRAKARAEQIFATTRQIFEIADTEGVPPSVAADRLAEQRMSDVGRLRGIWLGRVSGPAADSGAAARTALSAAAAPVRGAARSLQRRVRRKAGTVGTVRRLERATLHPVERATGGLHVSSRKSSAQRAGADWLRMFEGVEPMGRGRAKAKQVKVARQLKYNSGGTDLDRLRTELGVNRDDEDADGDDPYADLVGRYDDADDADEDDEDDDGRPSTATGLRSAGRSGPEG